MEVKDKFEGVHLGQTGFTSWIRFGDFSLNVFSLVWRPEREREREREREKPGGWFLGLEEEGRQYKRWNGSAIWEYYGLPSYR